MHHKVVAKHLILKESLLNLVLTQQVNRSLSEVSKIDGFSNQNLDQELV